MRQINQTIDLNEYHENGIKKRRETLNEEKKIVRI